MTRIHNTNVIQNRQTWGGLQPGLACIATGLAKVCRDGGLAVGLALLAGFSGAASAAQPAPVIIGHASVAKTDAATVARLYTGRTVEVAGVPVTVVNTAAGSALRERFLWLVLQQNEEAYRAYWTVRRHIGKGVPPSELTTPAEVIDFVQNTPGAIAYIDAADLRPGLHVVLKP